MPTIPSLGGLVASSGLRTGDVERCFLVGTFGGEGSSLVLRLFNGSGSTSRFEAGVGSEVEKRLRFGEAAVVGHEAVLLSGCVVCAGALVSQSATSGEKWTAIAHRRQIRLAFSH